jgi:hypothetical protein
MILHGKMLIWKNKMKLKIRDKIIYKFNKNNKYGDE